MMAEEKSGEVIDLGFFRENPRPGQQDPFEYARGAPGEGGDRRGGDADPPDDGGGGGGPTGWEPGGDEPPRPPWCSDAALGEALVKRIHGDWRYVTELAIWRHWDGQVWREDKVEAVVELAKDVCVNIAAQCKDKRMARGVASLRTIMAALRVARSHPDVAAPMELFKADLLLLNTPEGIVDLRTGVMSPHRREAFMSAITPVSPAGECPRFKQFLQEFACGDEEYARYLLRVAGYCLTGSMREHVIFFLHGEQGGEGKGVFVRSVLAAMGEDYGGVAMMGLFYVSYGERHPTELAALTHKRLVIATETQQGQEWAEGLVKAISGGDPITAREIGGKPFTFQPEFKLLLAGNHKPRIRSADGPMRRRVQIAPAEHHPKVVDLELEDKLAPELGGILKLLIEGAVDWWEIGLRPPAVVVRATNRYFAEQNPVARWIAAYMDIVDAGQQRQALKTDELYKSFCGCMQEFGEDALRQLAFTERLRRVRGVIYRRSKTERGWWGLAFKPVRGEFDLEGGEA